jgi:outer membrane receptor for ferrienterochelin and colicin/copper chaperone CopZ
MNKIYLLVCISVSMLLNTTAKAQLSSKKDSVASFKVSGVCDQCKNRIEKSLKIKGIKTAEWDVDTKMLSLVFDPSKITLDKVYTRLADVGHDTELKKAKESTYKALPDCCHYREMDANESHHDEGEVVLVDTASSQAHLVKGLVMEENNKGMFKPLEGASVIWLGKNTGTITNKEGMFEIEHEPGANQLVISYAGFKADTISIEDLKQLRIILASGSQLKEVRVTSRQASTYINAYNPFRTATITQKELFKAACCNLSESFETNPSVDVSYNDAITGSKQIQLLGLSGNYTQLTVENLPGPRGLATPLGLNSIAGPWVESIQLTKGIGSVVNGYESIAGQINVELKKPATSDKLYLNGYINTMGKTDLNLNLTHNLGKKWATTFLLHDDFLKSKQDFNKDGFRDLPTGNLFSAINRWQYAGTNGWMAQFGVKALVDDKTGGEVDYNSKQKFSTTHYGLGINTERYEAFGKIGYVFPEKKYQSIGLQLSAFDHTQDSYFGLTTYNGKQKNLYANLIYQSIINNDAHKFKTGLSFSNDDYREQFNGTGYKRNEAVPGAFFEYSYNYEEKFNVVAGLRADHNSLFGWFATPRLNIRYQPVNGTTIRIGVGRGQRTANIFAENNSVFASARQVNIFSNEPGKAYGLNPEVAWNKGISVDQKFKLFQQDATFGIDYYRNDFTNQLVVDLEYPREVNFYNLEGKSFSNSLQAELNIKPVEKFDVRLAYRFFDVKTTFGSQLLQKPLTARHRAFANLAYDLKGWKFDYTVNYIGTKRIPSTESNPQVYRLKENSPSYVLMNAQVSKALGKNKLFDAYVGGENLTNYFQKNVVLAADQPFSNYFDASMVWGPVSGRQVYVGFRYTIK